MEELEKVLESVPTTIFDRTVDNQSTVEPTIEQSSVVDVEKPEQISAPDVE